MGAVFRRFPFIFKDENTVVLAFHFFKGISDRSKKWFVCIQNSPVGCKFDTRHGAINRGQTVNRLVILDGRVVLSALVHACASPRFREDARELTLSNC